MGSVNAGTYMALQLDAHINEKGLSEELSRVFKKAYTDNEKTINDIMQKVTTSNKQTYDKTFRDMMSNLEKYSIKTKENWDKFQRDIEKGMSQDKAFERFKANAEKARIKFQENIDKMANYADEKLSKIKNPYLVNPSSARISATPSSSEPPIVETVRATESATNTVNNAGKAVDVVSAAVIYKLNVLNSVLNQISGALVSYLSSSINYYREVEKTLTLTTAVAKGTQSTFDDLKKSALEISRYAPKSILDISQSMMSLAQAGLSANEIMEVMPKAVQLAVGTGSDLNTTLQTTVATISAFNLEFSKAPAVLDIFAKASANTMATIEKLQYSLSRVSPFAEEANVSLEDTTTILSLLYNKGLKASVAGTVLSNTIQGLTTFTDRSRKALSEMGLSTSDVDLQFNTLEESFIKLTRAGMTAEQSFNIFNRRGKLITSIFSQMKNDVDGLDGSFQGLRDEVLGSGSNIEFFNVQVTTLDYALNKLKNAFDKIKIAIGDVSKDKIVGFANILERVAESISKNVKLLDNLKEIILFGGILAGLSSLAITFLKVGVALDVLGVKVKLFSGIMTALSSSAFALPQIGVVVLGIAASLSFLTSAISNYMSKKRDLEMLENQSLDTMDNMIEKLKALNEEQYNLTKNTENFNFAKSILESKMNTEIKSYEDLTDALKKYGEEQKKVGQAEKQRALASDIASLKEKKESLEKIQKDRQKKSSWLKTDEGEYATPYTKERKLVHSSLTAWNLKKYIDESVRKEDKDFVFQSLGITKESQKKINFGLQDKDITEKVIKFITDYDKDIIDAISKNIEATELQIEEFTEKFKEPERIKELEILESKYESSPESEKRYIKERINQLRKKLGIIIKEEVDTQFRVLDFAKGFVLKTQDDIKSSMADEINETRARISKKVMADTEGSTEDKAEEIVRRMNIEKKAIQSKYVETILNTSEGITKEVMLELESKGMFEEDLQGFITKYKELSKDVIGGNPLLKIRESIEKTYDIVLDSSKLAKILEDGDKKGLKSLVISSLEGRVEESLSKYIGEMLDDALKGINVKESTSTLKEILNQRLNNFKSKTEETYLTLDKNIYEGFVKMSSGVLKGSGFESEIVKLSEMSGRLKTKRGQEPEDFFKSVTSITEEFNKTLEAFRLVKDGKYEDVIKTISEVEKAFQLYLNNLTSSFIENTKGVKISDSYIKGLLEDNGFDIEKLTSKEIEKKLSILEDILKETGFSEIEIENALDSVYKSFFDAFAKDVTEALKVSKVPISKAIGYDDRLKETDRALYDTAYEDEEQLARFERQKIKNELNFLQDKISYAETFRKEEEDRIKEYYDKLIEKTDGNEQLKLKYEKEKQEDIEKLNDEMLGLLKESWERAKKLRQEQNKIFQEISVTFDNDLLKISNAISLMGSTFDEGGIAIAESLSAIVSSLVSMPKAFEDLQNQLKKIKDSEDITDLGKTIAGGVAWAGFAIEIGTALWKILSPLFKKEDNWKEELEKQTEKLNGIFKNTSEQIGLLKDAKTIGIISSVGAKSTSGLADAQRELDNILKIKKQSDKELNTTVANYETHGWFMKTMYNLSGYQGEKKKLEEQAKESKDAFEKSEAELEQLEDALRNVFIATFSDLGLSLQNLMKTLISETFNPKLMAESITSNYYKTAVIIANSIASLTSYTLSSFEEEFNDTMKRITDNIKSKTTEGDIKKAITDGADELADLWKTYVNQTIKINKSLSSEFSNSLRGFGFNEAMIALAGNTDVDSAIGQYLDLEARETDAKKRRSDDYFLLIREKDRITGEINKLKTTKKENEKIEESLNTKTKTNIDILEDLWIKLGNINDAIDKIDPLQNVEKNKSNALQNILAASVAIGKLTKQEALERIKIYEADNAILKLATEGNFIYDKELHQSQLKLEALKDELRISEELYPQNVATLKIQIKQQEYLIKLAEIENQRKVEQIKNQIALNSATQETSYQINNLWKDYNSAISNNDLNKAYEILNQIASKATESSRSVQNSIASAFKEGLENGSSYFKDNAKQILGKSIYNTIIDNITQGFIGGEKVTNAIKKLTSTFGSLTADELEKNIDSIISIMTEDMEKFDVILSSFRSKLGIFDSDKPIVFFDETNLARVENVIDEAIDASDGTDGQIERVETELEKLERIVSSSMSSMDNVYLKYESLFGRLSSKIDEQIESLISSEEKQKNIIVNVTVNGVEQELEINVDVNS